MHFLSTHSHCLPVTSALTGDFLYTQVVNSLIPLHSAQLPTLLASPEPFIHITGNCFLSVISNHYLLFSNQLTCFVATLILP